MKARFATLLVLAAAFVAPAIANPAPAYGCSCVVMTVDEAIGPDTPAAFIGRPVSVADNPNGGLLGGDVWAEPRTWTFEVETVLVGDLPEVVEVGSGFGGGDCGYDFSDSGRVGVVAYGSPGNFSTGICGGVWDADALLAAYGPGFAPITVTAEPPPGPVDSGPPMWFWFVMGGVTVAAAGAAIALGSRSGPSQDGWTGGDQA